MASDVNLYSRLREAFPADLDTVAIRMADGLGRTYSWRDLEQGSARIANALGGLGLPRAARVAVQVEKSVEALMLYLGVVRAGLVFVPLNPAYQAGELQHLLSDAEPGLFVCTQARLHSSRPLAEALGIPHVFTLDDDGTGTLLKALAGVSAEHTPVVVGSDDLAAILYTSGTTGRSKGAMLSHGNLRSNAEDLHRVWGWSAADVIVHVLPIFHVHGLFVAAQGALIAGARMIWFNRFDAPAVLRQFPSATVFMGVPTLYVRLLKEPALNVDACRTMRLFAAGSAPLLPDTFRQWQERTGHAIVERYGMSETVILTSNPYHAANGQRRVGTVGKPLPGIELRIVDEAGHPVSRGTIGGIEVRGSSVCRGYWRAPEANAREFTGDGWFRTGDVGRLDEHDYLIIVGRSKDLIISGGFNVYPAEVEECLNAIAGIGESAVVGVPHPEFGEGVIAIVTARESGVGSGPEAEIIARMKNQIAAFKVPKRVFWVAQLPRNVMGKVEKAKLRETYRNTFAQDGIRTPS